LAGAADVRVIDHEAHPTQGAPLTDRDLPDFAKGGCLVMPSPRSAEVRIALTGLRQTEEFDALLSGLVVRWDPH